MNKRLSYEGLFFIYERIEKLEKDDEQNKDVIKMLWNENNSLNASLIEERKKLEEYTNKFLYLQADFENYKKRMLQESSEIEDNAQIKSMDKFIDLKSDLDLAIDQIPDDEQDPNASSSQETRKNAMPPTTTRAKGL